MDSLHSQVVFDGLDNVKLGYMLVSLNQSPQSLKAFQCLWKMQVFH